MMQGFLQRVSGGERLKRRWCVLEDSVLTLYADDGAGRAQEQCSKKGSIGMAGCSIAITDASKFQLQITHIGDKFVVLRAEDAGCLSAWVYALQVAIKNTLPIMVNVEEDTAFRPVTEDSFKSVKFSLAMSLNFEAVLHKTPGSGFGLVIESTGGGIQVKERGEGVSILSIMPESVGTVQVGDRLLKINDQDVHDWSISSIVDLIGDENMPVSSSARFSFTRKNHSVPIRPRAERGFSPAPSPSSRSSDRSPSDSNNTPREAMPSPRELFAQYNVLECGICTESFEESGDLCPHVLSCGHSFCHKDLKRLLLVSADSFRCPTCLRRSKRSQYDDSFPPKNYSMLEAISFEYQSLEDIDVRGKAHTPEEGGCSGCGEQNLLVHCFDCKADFCSTCNITIHQPVKFKAHRRGAVEAREVVKTLCPVHNEKLKVYCFSPSCRTPICVLCTTIGTHKSHDYRPIQDVFVAEKQEFKEKLQEEVGLLSELSAMHEQKRAAMDALNQSRVQAASAIEDDFREARRRLDSLEQDALDALNVYVDERLEPLKADVARITDLQFMSHYAEADARMKKTSAMAGALLEEFGSESEGGPTSVDLVGRAAGGIVIENCCYSFSDGFASTKEDFRLFKNVGGNRFYSAYGSSGSFDTSVEAAETPR